MTNEKAVLWLSANKPVVGRDQDAINLWIETPGWLDRQQRNSWFQRWDGIWLTAHGGTTNTAFDLLRRAREARRVAPHGGVRSLGVPRPDVPGGPVCRTRRDGRGHP